MSLEDSSEPRLLTVHELARRLGVKATWVYRHGDQLGAYRLGKYLRFSWPKVLLVLDGNRGLLKED